MQTLSVSCLYIKWFLFVFETGFEELQAGLELVMESRMTLDFWPSSFYLLNFRDFKCVCNHVKLKPRAGAS